MKLVDRFVRKVKRKFCFATLAIKLTATQPSYKQLTEGTLPAKRIPLFTAPYEPTTHKSVDYRP
jgi:hypothetical protein